MIFTSILSIALLAAPTFAARLTSRKPTTSTVEGAANLTVSGSNGVIVDCTPDGNCISSNANGSNETLILDCTDGVCTNSTSVYCPNDICLSTPTNMLIWNNLYVNVSAGQTCLYGSSTQQLPVSCLTCVIETTQGDYTLDQLEQSCQSVNGAATSTGASNGPTVTPKSNGGLALADMIIGWAGIAPVVIGAIAGALLM
ncbi:hypothetical protein CALCODRAFT_556902 [Calocera cornea HHB12733]|uniref:Uncharacterized protein n=1 Tax=Calocera cornea HHB12733 TaxID=1353952 RepID=A0A165EBP4_9BASI|nr:hypothetical protein CALCODRAFT_556902 [Calocera cornea HHB12733]